MFPPSTEVPRIIAQGEAAERLLRNQDYVEVLNTLSDFHLAALVACPPGPTHSETREHHHLMIHALQEINSEVQRRAAALLDLRMDDMDEPDEDMNEH